jgi:hypothetical protein
MPCECLSNEQNRRRDPGFPRQKGRPRDRGVRRRRVSWKLFKFHSPLLNAALTRGWAVGAGVITMLLIGTKLSPSEQGFYFTFYSLLGLQTFMELNLASVIIHFASHEWAGLKLNDQHAIEGNPVSLNRLVALGRFAFRWYLFGGLLLIVVVGCCGFWFLGKKHYTEIDWKLPWIMLVTLAGLQFTLIPWMAVLEGCNQIVTIFRFRLISGILSSVTLWITLTSKLGLWSPCVSFFFLWIAQMIFIFWVYRGFFRSFIGFKGESTLSWKTEVLPMQWRLAISGIVGYFATYFFVPVMFNYQGSVVAGQMGATMQITSTLQGLAQIWVQVSIPTFGILIAQRNFKELDDLFYRQLKRSTLVLAGLSVAACVGIFTLKALGLAIASRVLPIFPMAVLLFAGILLHVTSAQAAYLRAHKQELLMPLSVTACTAIALLVWFFGKNNGATGAVVAYFVVVALYIFPTISAIWLNSRKKWHAA